MGITAAIAQLMVPLITITIQFMIAFVILVWFTLSLIYAIIEIINLLLGQPFVGWILTGKINASNDIREVFFYRFSFTSPIMIFLYTGIIISLILFLIYFISGFVPLGKNNELGSLNTRWIGLMFIILSIVWMPFLYSILIVATSGLILGLNSLLNIANKSHSSSEFNIETWKENVLNNLETLKNLKKEIDFNKVDLNSDQVKTFIEKYLDSNSIVSFNYFIENWNKYFSNLSIDKIEIWIKSINEIDIKNLNSLSLEQKTILNELGIFSQGILILNKFYSDIINFIPNKESLLLFNNILMKSNTIDLSNFFLNDSIFILNKIDKNKIISDFCFYVINNKIIYSNNFSQNLVNVLYSLTLGKPSIFVAGWSSDLTAQGWNLFEG